MNVPPQAEMGVKRLYKGAYYMTICLVCFGFYCGSEKCMGVGTYRGDGQWAKLCVSAGSPCGRATAVEMG